MGIVTKLDEGGKFAWIATMIVSFVIFWQAGLAILAYMIWSGRMGCRNHAYEVGMRSDWRSYREEWRARKREMRDTFRAERHRFWNTQQSSGNTAFDDYKSETLKRLEEEQAEFNDFLANLRKSKDKAEFDQFMQSRRGNTQPVVDEDDQHHGDIGPGA